MKIGLVGLPKSGKTSLFNLLTGQSVATSSFGTARGEMHAGIARVPDERVDRLSALFRPKKTTYATFEVVDLAGIKQGERAGLETQDFGNAAACPVAGSRRGARAAGLHLPLLQADPALSESRREGRHRGRAARGRVRPPDRGRAAPDTPRLGLGRHRGGGGP